jgi:two-component sensor histidine kinase
MPQAQTSPTLDRLIRWSLQRPLSPFSRYAIVTLVMVVTALVRMWLVTSLLPWLPFIPLVLLAGLMLGRKSGVYAALLSTLLAGLTLARAENPWWLTGQQWIASALYAVVTTGVGILAAELRAAFRRAAHLTAELSAAIANAEVLEASRADALQRLVANEAQLQLVNQELGHRLKNQLAIVQAVVSQTLRQASDVKSASDALMFRLASLGQATDMLTATEWRAADLRALVAAALTNHEAVAGRIQVDGPPIRFNPQVALAITLALHELITNAIKYGALSNETGHVELRWSVSGEPPDSRFALSWREMGGPAVTAPTRRGFGSVMIERSLRAYFRGETQLLYNPEGLEFRIEAPVGPAQVEGE